MTTEEKTEAEKNTKKEEKKSTELARKTEAALETFGGPQASGLDVLSNLRLEPKTFDQALVCAELAFKMKLGKVDSIADAMVRIMRGATVGLDAMTSIEQIFVVGERTGMYARIMHALVMRRRDVCAELKILEEQCTDKCAYVRARRVGDSAATLYKFTAEEAEALVGKKKFNDPESNYSKDRKGMLIAKALKRAIDREWPDVVAGFTTVEDLRDIVEVDRQTGEVTVISSTATGKPERDFAKELKDFEEEITKAADDAAFANVRKSIGDWTAPESFVKQAQSKYNEARTAWKDAQKKGAP